MPSKGGRDDNGVDAAKQQESETATTTTTTIINKYDPEKKERLELVAGSRPRCVPTDILPPKHVVTAMEQLFKEKLERDQANYFLKQGLGGGDSIDAARGEIYTYSAYIHTFIHIPKNQAYSEQFSLTVYTCMMEGLVQEYAYVHSIVCIHTYIHTYIHPYIHSHICTYNVIHICI